MAPKSAQLDGASYSIVWERSLHDSHRMRRYGTVSGLATPLGITLTAVVQHLQVLEESGLVRTEKLGRVRTCRLETGLSVLEQWIRDRRSLWERRLDRLGDLFAQ